MQQLLNILHLEDSKTDADIVRHILETAGISVHITRVQTDADFESVLRQRAFDLILSDYSLPAYDGISALKFAKQICEATPFIFVSGTMGEDIAVESLKHGATDYVMKGRLTRLPAAVARAVREALEKTELSRATEQLRESEERFRQLAENSHDVFWFMGYNPERVLYVSPAVEEVWGLPPERFYQDKGAWIDAVHPDDRPSVLRAYEAFVRGQSREFTQEYRVVRPDGSVRWVLDSGTLVRNDAGEIIRAGGIARDITDQKLYQERIQEQAALLDRARDAIFVCDLENRIQYWNQSAEQLYGWTADEVTGRPFPELLLPGRTEQLVTAETKLLQQGDWAGELHHAIKSGKTIVVESRWTLVRDHLGNPKAKLILNTDITARKDLEARFLRAQRLESVGTLAGGIAHDLNNALTPITMSLELLQLEFGDKASELLPLIRSSAQRATEMVRQLLTFAKGAEGKRMTLQPKHSLREIETMIRGTFPKSIQLHIKVAADLATITADPTQLDQVLLNLCVNARDAMPTGGTLTIEAKNVQVDEGYAGFFAEAKPGRYICIEVTDTGSGIPQEIRDRIFDPFFTTKGPEKGTGLGLSTVLGIVQSHGGFIRLYSEVGRGTSFYVYFPAASPSDEIKLTPAPAREHQGNNECILVVEDEERIRVLIRENLAARNFKVLLAADGFEGLAKFAEHREQINMVLTDLGMPHMDGALFIRGLRRLCANTPILAMTGLDNETRADELRRLGVEHFLSKPFTVPELVAGIRECLQPEHRPRK